MAWAGRAAGSAIPGQPLLLEELAQPSNRLGICVVSIFNDRLLGSFLSFTENDDRDVFDSVHRVLRRTQSWLEAAADERHVESTVWTDDFAPLTTFAASKPAFQAVNLSRMMTPSETVCTVS